jgi:glycosyltransferase involved in cell wall biosynthesis
VTALHEVVIDARWLRTGIGRYTFMLLKDLKPRLPNTRLTCVTMPAHAAALAPHCDRVIEMNCGIYSLTEQFLLPFTARGAAVFCAPHYNIPVLRRGPIVTTIHDLTHLLFPAYRGTLRARVYADTMLRIASSRAWRIVAPSRYTRDSLVEYLGADPAKISVIPCGISENFRPQPKEQAVELVGKRYGITAPYILFVGSAAPHKNLATLLKGYRLLSAKRRAAADLVLVLPRNSAAKWHDRELQQLIATPGVHCLYSVSDGSLASLYSAAGMTVMPSFEEGFGLPVIESMACGTPVACSRAASLPEIAGDGAIYFDPYSVEELVWAIDKLMNSEGLQRSLREKGLQRAAAYGGNRAANAYAAILSSVVAEEVRGATLERQHGS